MSNVWLSADITVFGPFLCFCAISSVQRFSGVGVFATVSRYIRLSTVLVIPTNIIMLVVVVAGVVYADASDDDSCRQYSFGFLPLEMDLSFSFYLFSVVFRFSLLLLLLLCV